MKISTTVAPLLVFASKASAKLFSKEAVNKILAAGVATRKTMDENLMACMIEYSALQVTVGEAPTPEEEDFGDYCEMKKKGKLAICDYNLYDSSAYEAACQQNGGKIITVKHVMCDEEMPFKKLVVNNLKQCVGMSCDEETAITLHEKFNEMIGMHCPNEDKNAKFILKWNKKKAKAVMMKCKKLAKKKKAIRDEICFGSKFQVYNDGLLPASQVCGKTCKELPMDGIRVEESKEAIFVTQDPQDGEEINQTCEWLQAQNEMMQSGICMHAYMMAMMSPSESKYGTALEICTSTCMLDIEP